MRTINIYQFNELSEEAKKVAIEKMRERLKHTNSDEAYDWAIDDCALFEPPHKEMAELFGEDYYEKNHDNFVFKNHRKGLDYEGSFGTIHIKEALEITNKEMFLEWLGFPKKYQKYISFNFFQNPYTSTTLIIDNEFLESDPRYNYVAALIKNAEEKFKTHVEEIKSRIESSYDDYFSDDEMEIRISENEMEFYENGLKYNGTAEKKYEYV